MTAERKIEFYVTPDGRVMVAENELNKAMAMTFEDWQADRQQLLFPGFED